MNTNSNMRGAAAAVAGARHHRAGRAGQDAAALWFGDGVAAAVVCDGCSAGSDSEIGARFGAGLWLRAVQAQLEAGRAVRDPALWDGVRAEVIAGLRTITALLGDVVRSHLLFTIVGAAVDRDDVAVWAVGDGAYALGGEAAIALGPFADNAPPYLAYELLGDGPAAHLAVASRTAGRVLVATDGLGDLEPAAAAALAEPALADHPDALRRRLALAARATDRIDWAERRVIRAPVALQDDCAVAVLHWQVAS